MNGIHYISMSKYIYANIFHSIFGGAHYVNISVIETPGRNPCSSKEGKNKDTHMLPLCAHSMWSLAKTGLSSDLHGPE